MILLIKTLLIEKERFEKNVSGPIDSEFFQTFKILQCFLIVFKNQLFLNKHFIV